MAKRKLMCRKCNRRMVVELENHEECSNPECAYYFSYEFDLPAGVTAEQNEKEFQAYMEAVKS